MGRELTNLRDTAHLDELLELSRVHPLLLFKHSDTCGTSFEALDALVAHMAGPQVSVRYAMVTVQDQREVSDAVAARLGVRHETPQAILVRDGQVVWTASHFRINVATLAQAVRKY